MKGLSTTALLVVVLLIGAAAIFYLQRGATPGEKLTPTGNIGQDPEPCASNQLVIDGIITLNDCKQKMEREAIYAAQKEESERIEGEEKRLKRDRQLEFFTGGLRKLFPNWHA